MTNEEMVVVKQALDLRKRGLIGVLWAEQGTYWISANEVDPHGSRVRVSLERLREMVESFERKPVATATEVAELGLNSSTCEKNKSCA
jgi:hypothetical protein